jgi:hypothetical protein
MTKVEALNNFTSAFAGGEQRRKGDQFWLSEQNAKILAEAGNVRVLEQAEEIRPFAYETKPAPASLSQAAPVPLMPTSGELAVELASSSSTTATVSPRGPTPSTPATASGGTTTTPKRGRRSRASSGRKTKGRRGGSDSTES